MSSQSTEINELAAALAKAQGEIESAKKDSENPHYRSKYADLASVWDACRGPLSKNGLSVVQTVGQDDAGMCLVTTLLHSSGQWTRSEMHLLIGKQDMQGLGSAITYARRYSLAAIVGVAQDDDDGNGSLGSSSPPKTPGPVYPDQPGPNDGIVGPKPIARRSVFPKADEAQPAPMGCECGGVFNVSKFNKNELYCTTCKAKKPIVA